jgi:D-aspartate ligase
MSSKTQKAIIFNCHYNGLSIIQELGQHSIECIAMDSVRSIGTYSKYAKHQKCPNPIENESAFIEFLYSYCAREKEPPVVFPTNDHWAMAISKYKEKLSEVAVLCVADWEAVKTVINKDIFYELGKEKEYLTPNTWSINELKQLNIEDFPIIAKPRFRRMASNDKMSVICINLDRLRFTILNNKRELDAFLDKESEFIDYLIFQEYIPGMSDQMYTVGIYANDKSDILGLFTGHKVRGYPADSGDCIVGENYNLPDYVIENTYRIVRNLKYSGIAEFEYKKDLSTGMYKLIEVNPRSWSWIGITPACGASLPLIAYQDLSREKVTIKKPSLENGSVKYMKVLEDLRNCLILYKNNYPKWSKSFKEWKQDIKASKTIYAEFNSNDWLVGLKAILDMLYIIIISIPKKLFNKINR